LDHAADLVVAADDGVERALLRGLGQVAAELLERLVLVLRVLVGDAVRAADLGDRGGELVAGRAGIDARVAREREQQVLRGDVLVPERACLLVGAAEQLDRGARHGGRGARVAGDGRQLVERGVRLRAHRLRIGADLAQHWDDDPLVLLEQREQQVVRRHLGVVARAREPLSGGEGLLGLNCESVSLHKKSKRMYSRYWCARPKLCCGPWPRRR
jgi:hypothetical protein